MEDRELLELVAKAAGFRDVSAQFSDDGRHQFRGVDVTDEGGNCFFWNPLIDDGDALRLATMLGFCVDTRCADEIVVWGGGQSGRLMQCEHIGVNHQAAVRRAIVVAAAELSAQKPATV